MVRLRTPAELGALARAARRARGWNQQRAADAAGVSRRFVTRLESGGHAGAELWRVLTLLDAVDAVDAVGAELVGTLGGPAARLRGGGRAPGPRVGRAGRVRS